MKHLKAVAKQYRVLMAVYILMGLTHTFLANFGASYFRTVIDNFTNGTLTLMNIALYGAALIGTNVVCYIDNYPARKLDHGMGLSLKTAALKKLARIDYRAYTGLGTGTLVQRIENGAAAGKNMLFSFYLRLAAELLPAMMFSILFIFLINKAVTVAILLGYVVVFIVTNLLLKALYKVKKNILVNEEKFNHFLVRGFMEMVVFRVNRRFSKETEKAESAAGEIVASKVKMTMIHEAFFVIFAVLVGFVKIGLIVYGWTTKALTIGEIVALISLVDNAYTPVAIFNVVYVEYKLDKLAFQRYAEFLDAAEDGHLSSGKTLGALKGAVNFAGVGFSYGERRILKGLSLSIKQGETVAFVGESGSGKSTAVKLLAGLLHPEAGKILIDGADLDGINLNSFYEKIAYLPQEPAVFDGTLRENLVFDEKYDDKLLLEALENAGLSALYQKLPQGLDTQLGERGVTLSGGERQQLALARLWFTDAGLVILDEATSAIDNLTEKAIMGAVLKRLKGKTLLAVAHRLDSVKRFDSLVIFREGEIAEQGGFAELMEGQGLFFQLYTRETVKAGVT